MMNIHVHTQYQENYSDDPTRPYWKFKGGSTYVIVGFNHPLTAEIGPAAERVVKALASSIEYENEMAIERIIDWEFAPADKLTDDEEMQLRYDGRIDYPSKRVAIPSELMENRA